MFSYITMRLISQVWFFPLLFKFYCTSMVQSHCFASLFIFTYVFYFVFTLFPLLISSPPTLLSCYLSPPHFFLLVLSHQKDPTPLLIPCKYPSYLFIPNFHFLLPVPTSPNHPKESASIRITV